MTILCGQWPALPSGFSSGTLGIACSGRMTVEEKTMTFEVTNKVEEKMKLERKMKTEEEWTFEET